VGRRLLDQLLVAALERAVPLADGHDLAEAVSQQLDLDVARRIDQALEVDGAIAEGRCGFGRGRAERHRQVGWSVDAPHAAAASPGRRLDEQRKADSLGLVEDPVQSVGSVEIERLPHSGDTRDPGCVSDSPGCELVAEFGDRGGRGSDEREPGGVACDSELGPLGKESVAGMNSLGACRQRCVDHGVRPKIALGRRRRSDPNGMVREAHVERIGIDVGVDRDRLHAEVAGCPDDPNRDLPAVRDQHTPEWRIRPADSAVSAQRHPRAGCCHASFAG
jgi:hypothetical protein